VAVFTVHKNAFSSPFRPVEQTFLKARQTPALLFRQEEEEESPVDRLIRQGSLEEKKTTASIAIIGAKFEKTPAIIFKIPAKMFLKIPAKMFLKIRAKIFKIPAFFKFPPFFEYFHHNYLIYRVKKGRPFVFAIISGRKEYTFSTFFKNIIFICYL
jgi:hypothetical protein